MISSSSHSFPRTRISLLFLPPSFIFNRTNRAPYSSCQNGRPSPSIIVRLPIVRTLRSIVPIPAFRTFASSPPSPPSPPSSSSSSSPLSSTDRATITDTEATIRTLQQNIRYALDQGKYNQAKEYATECEKVTLNYYGEAHPVYASSLNNLSLVYKHLGFLDEAVTYSTKALEIYEKLTGKESSSTATALGNLGLLHLALANKTKGFAKVGHIDAGYAVLDRAWRIRQTILDKLLEPSPSSPSTEEAGAINDRKTNNETKTTAPPSSNVTVQDIPPSVMKSLRLNIGIALYQFAAAARMKKQYGESEKLYHQSLAYLKEHINDRNIYYATALNNLGYLYKEWNHQYSKAELYYRQALQLRQQILGKTHPDTIATYHNIAEIKRYQGQEDEAQNIQKEILNILGYKDEETEGEKMEDRRNTPTDSRNV